jgi:hypothetical protein
MRLIVWNPRSVDQPPQNHLLVLIVPVHERRLFDVEEERTSSTGHLSVQALPNRTEDCIDTTEVDGDNVRILQTAIVAATRVFPLS